MHTTEDGWCVTHVCLVFAMSMTTWLPTTPFASCNVSMGVQTHQGIVGDKRLDSHRLSKTLLCRQVPPVMRTGSSTSGSESPQKSSGLATTPQLSPAPRGTIQPVGHGVPQAPLGHGVPQEVKVISRCQRCPSQMS